LEHPWCSLYPHQSADSAFTTASMQCLKQDNERLARPQAQETLLNPQRLLIETARCEDAQTLNPKPLTLNLLIETARCEDAQTLNPKPLTLNLLIETARCKDAQTLNPKPLTLNLLVETEHFEDGSHGGS
jgi:hypothetical protein